ncbi:hypothetical protein C0991_010289 [Blastosporella zonata]|nr:hypothetical protein C0991_010289 [Blastosporella zonata]
MSQHTTTTTTTTEPPPPDSLTIPILPPPELSTETDPPDPTPAPKDEEPLPVPDPENPPESEEDIINMETWDQIIELDDNPNHDFSKGMTWAYFAQAEKTFKDIDEALSKKDLNHLSSLGHFLKGSSAALGLSKVQASCEKIQHYGKMRDEEAVKETDKNLSKEESLSRITALRKQVQKDYIIAERWLKNWYKNNATYEPEASDGERDS